MAGCGGGSSGLTTPTIGAAHTYVLRVNHHGTSLALQIIQPDGTPLVRFKHGGGPHTGVHVILVRRDLHVIIHEHPPVAANGRFVADLAGAAPGPYRLVVDAYPAPPSPQPNFQLFADVHIAGKYVPIPLEAPRTSDVVDGYRFALHGEPALHAISPAFLHFTVTTPTGAPARFTPWYGALAHAIFFRVGTLDYFHTHVCAPGASGCTSVFGAAKVTGRSSTPGKLDVGVLVPVPGTWRLFLQCRVAGNVLTAPFVLHVR